VAIATACLVSDSPVPRRSRRVGWGSGARIHVGCPPADPPIAASFARRPSDCPAMGRQASGAIFRLGDIRTRRRATGCDWGIYVDAHHGRRKYRLRCFSSLLLVATMRLSLFTPNKSAQPMPGARLGFNRHHLARHGWPQRSVCRSTPWAVEAQHEKPYVLELAYAHTQLTLPRADGGGTDSRLAVTDAFLEEATRIRVGVLSTEAGTVELGDGCKVVFRVNPAGAGFMVQFFCRPRAVACG
jgi:hypothetical protein